MREASARLIASIGAETLLTSAQCTVTLDLTTTTTTTYNVLQND